VVVPEANPGDQPRTELNNRLTYLERTWNEVNASQSSIMETVEEEGLIEAENDELDQAEARYFRIKSQFQAFLSLVYDDGSEQSETNGRANGPPDQNRSRWFSGDVLQWTSFHDLFEAMVHKH
jgi:hypothetical protein